VRAIEKQLDILVNNAAFQEHTESIEELTDEHFDLTMKTNVYGAFYLTCAAGRGRAGVCLPRVAGDGVVHHVLPVIGGVTGAMTSQKT
jgi:NAD(P)-dependent dehydrogenase (short-subunit alcohol dehydrogenase family)